MPTSLVNGIEAFQGVAATYDDWFDTPLGRFVDTCELRALASLLPQDPVDSVVEIGAGTGHLARLLCQYAHQVTAIEPSAAMRSQGQKQTANLPLTWQDARAEHLPCLDAQFDGAVLFTTLEFVEQPDLALTEALRVVRPGGWVIVGVLHALSAWTALYRYKGDRGKLPWAAAQFFTRADLEAWMGFPAEQSAPAVYLSPQAEPPFPEADEAGKRAGNPPAMDVLRWRKSR